MSLTPAPAASGGVNACALVPCLDAASTLGAVVRRARAHVGTVIVVDDGSVDDSVAVATEAGAVVVRHPSNRGKGHALLTGLAAAGERGHTHAVALDADGQHDPDDIPGLLAAARARPDALIVGARDFDVPHVPGGSRFGRAFSNFWVALETFRRLTDTQSGFRVYPVALTLALRVPPSRFQWEVEVLVRAAWAGLEVRDEPVRVYYPPPDERTSHFRGFVDSARLSVMHTRLVFRQVLRLVWPTRRLLPRP
ncbi:MAG: glycosyltransferase family 2 protein [Deltaproteobacteria bacterium]|nr:glycosyltransferase family 2 protein [Deltaproteobacteria bacterium]MCB9787220.1 glycosyltransferase family 2 protein [Deltaproteobacteria bacterium]